MPQVAGTRPKPLDQIKSAWGRHVRTWMESHPGIKYKDAQQQAKASYAGAKAKAPARARAPPKGKAPKPVPAPKPTVHEVLQPWRVHLNAYREANPGTAMKTAMQEAKVTYRTSGKSEQKETMQTFEEALRDAKAAHMRERRQEGKGKEPEPKHEPKPRPKVEAEPAIVRPKVEPVAAVAAMKGSGRCGCGRRTCKCDTRRCKDDCCA